MKAISQFRIDTLYFEVFADNGILSTKMVNDDFPEESIETEYENFLQFKEVFEDEIEEEVLTSIEKCIKL